MIATAIAMTAVHNHPIALSPRDSVNCPITFGAIAMIMITTTSGTATTPLITAVQNSAFTGSKPIRRHPTMNESA
jgi:hypothetical protein